MPKEKSPTQKAAEKAQKQAKIKAAHKAGNMIPVRREPKGKKSSRQEYEAPKATKKTKAAAKKRKRDAVPEPARDILNKRDKFVDLMKRFGVGSKKKK
jgi:hypothetical protein